MYNCRIYKIINSIDDKIYIGSTKNTLSRRMAQHRSKSKCTENNMKLFQHMREYGITNFYIELIEEKEVSSKAQQFILESKYQRELNPELNRLHAHNTEEQRKEMKKRGDKIYKERTNYNKVYYQNDKDNQRQRSKEYKENNKDKVSDYNKLYSIKNKEELKLKRRERNRIRKEQRESSSSSSNSD